MMFRALLITPLLMSLLACEPAEPQSSSQPVNAASSVLVVDIEGMHCTACAASIATTVGSCDGIRSADVSFADGNATFTADDADALQRAMQTARDMGYTVEPSQPNGS